MIASLMTTDGLAFLFRWFHFIFGIIWIGLLYYFNFVQGAFFAEADANTKSAATQKLVPRALWWFRMGALWTAVTGLLILGIRGQQMGAQMGQSSYGVNILIGTLLGLTMAYNVWFVIWPNQKVVIQNAVQTASGGAAIPDAAARGAKSLLASRTNVLFSIPMLFFMGAASHLNYPVSNPGLLFGLVGIVWAALEFNGLKGKLGPMTTVKGVLSCGFALAAVFVAIITVTQ